MNIYLVVALVVLVVLMAVLGPRRVLGWVAMVGMSLGACMDRSLGDLQDDLNTFHANQERQKRRSSKKQKSDAKKTAE